MRSNLFIILLFFGISQLCCVSNNYVESYSENNINGNSNQNAANKIVLDEQLEFNRKLWSKNNIKDYNFKMEIYETGLTGLFSQVEIKVRNGKVSDFNVNGNTQNQDKLQDELAPYNTIEKLFDFIQKKFEQKQEYLTTGKPVVGKFNISYDPKLGFPSEIKYIPFSGAMDGDLYISIKDFVNLTE